MVFPILFIVEVTKPKAKTLKEASEPMELALFITGIKKTDLKNLLFSKLQS